MNVIRENDKVEVKDKELYVNDRKFQLSDNFAQETPFRVEENHILVTQFRDCPSMENYWHFNEIEGHYV